MLYIVATPIGNLGDMTFRAVEVLKSVDLIASEDSRKTSVLLKHYDISKPQTALNNFNERKVVPVTGTTSEADNCPGHHAFKISDRVTCCA